MVGDGDANRAQSLYDLGRFFFCEVSDPYQNQDLRLSQECQVPGEVELAVLEGGPETGREKRAGAQRWEERKDRVIEPSECDRATTRRRERHNGHGEPEGNLFDAVVDPPIYPSVPVAAFP